MGIKTALCVFVAAVLTSCVYSNQCPPEEDIPNCHCYHDSPNIYISCRGNKNGRQQDLETDIRMLQKSFNNKTTLDVFFSSYSVPANMSTSFRGLRVRKLSFDKCHLESSGGPAFPGLENSLKTITIERSMLAPERYGTFHQRFPFTMSHFRKLRTVIVEDNRFYEVSSDWFSSGGQSVVEVYLEKNEIHDIEDMAFSKLTNLTMFNAKYNKISQLKREMFPNPATYLEKLFFTGNDVRELPQNMFVNMPALSIVDFDANKLVHVHESTWKPVWSQLEFVYLGVDLNCGEEMEWTFSTKSPKTIYGLCARPGKRTGETLAHVIHTQLPKK